MLLPAVAVAGALLAIDRSACALIVVDAVEVLLPVFVSALLVVAVAGLLTTVPLATDGAACTVIVNCALCPLPSKPMSHATVPLVPATGMLQVAAGPVSCVSEMKLISAGR